MITKWEKSGNGGENKIEDDRFGQTSLFMEDADFQDDDDLSNYLSNNRTSTLLTWVFYVCELFVRILGFYLSSCFGRN